MSNRDDIEFERGANNLEEVLKQQATQRLLRDASTSSWCDVTELARELEELVYGQLPRPWPLLPPELAECVRDHVVMHKDSTFEFNFGRLLTAVRCRYDLREVDISLHLPLPILRWARLRRPIELVTLPSGVRCTWKALFREHRPLDAGPDDFAGVQATFGLKGCLSQAAIKRASESVSEALESLCPIMFSYGLFNLDERLYNLLGPEFASGGSAEAVEAHLQAIDEPLPEDDPDEIEQIRDISTDVHGVMACVAELINRVCVPLRSKKESRTFERRLANAVELIVCASRLSERSVKLALLMSALEALACRKQEGIADELANNCAALLLPDSTARLKAIKAVKKLYGVRSRALHGEAMGATAADVRRAEELCGAALSAVTDWIRFQERCGLPGTRDGFFDELDEVRLTGRALTGVPERLAAGLGWVNLMEASED